MTPGSASGAGGGVLAGTTLEGTTHEEGAAAGEEEAPDGNVIGDAAISSALGVTLAPTTLTLPTTTACRVMVIFHDFILGWRVFGCQTAFSWLSVAIQPF